MKYFTSDLHLFHSNVIKHANRPFKNVDEMNEALVNNINSRVKSNDDLYLLGDISFGTRDNTYEILSRINGIKYLILGNHDKGILRWKDVQSLFYKITPMLEIKVLDNDLSRGYQDIVMLHYSMRVWNKSHHGSWHLYGHSHGTLPDDPNSLSIDVGVDCHNYQPISYDEIKSIMSKKEFKPVDHHGR